MGLHTAGGGIYLVQAKGSFTAPVETESTKTDESAVRSRSSRKEKRVLGSQGWSLTVGSDSLKLSPLDLRGPSR